MMRLSLLLSFFLISSSLFGQQPVGRVKAMVMDSTTMQPMAGATIVIITTTDSALVNYSITDSTGRMQVDGLAINPYILNISFRGFDNVETAFAVSSNQQTIDLGFIYLKKNFQLLDTFVAVAAPIEVKGDTTQFNASAFTTMPNASAEDLLKKLPGVEVDTDGNVKAQGEEVTRIFVDGKEFFGKDPKMATKNITADMIQSVQVFDDMSDQAKFTRIDDGSRSKTINIVLKKNRRNGYFGRAVAGIGNNDRYLTSLTANRFTETRRVSLVVASNNINRQIASLAPRTNNIIRGGKNQALGPGNGITTSTVAGLNYIDKIGKKIEITSSYQFAENQTRSTQTSYRESTFFNDSSATENSVSTGTNTNRNHQFNLRLEYYIDSMNSILYTPNIAVQQSNSYSQETSSTTSITPAVKYVSNSNDAVYSSVRNVVNINNEFLYRRRFKKTGRTFTLGYSNVNDHSNANSTSISPIIFFNADGSVATVIDQNFESRQNTKSTSNVISSSFTEMLSKQVVLELNYAYTNRHSSSDKDAYDYNSASKKFDIINRQQTNYFENDFIAHRYGGSLKFQLTKYSFQVGTSMQTSLLDNKSVRGIYYINGKDSAIFTKQRYTNLFPTANFVYNFTKKTNLRIHYRGRTNQPGVNQLQDVPDLTNLLRIRVGNPALKQEFGHNIDISFKTLNPTTFKYLNIAINGSQTSNRIVNSTDSVNLVTLQNLGLPDSLLRPGVQIIRPLNLNGAYNFSTNITVGIPFKKLKGSSINFTNSVNYNHNLSMLYKQLNATNTFTIAQSAGLNIDVKDKFNVGLKAKVAYAQARYSISAGRNNTDYYIQTYSLDINYTIRKTLIVSTNFDYTKYTGQSAGFNRSIPLWNANVAKQFFKKKNGELKLSVNDLLNQNQNINRSQGENYYYDTRTVVLKRYFLLTCTYNLNRFGGKKLAAGKTT